MARSARVDSLHLLKDLRASVIGFAESAKIALGEADSDIHRTLSWLSAEAEPHWRGQARKCAESLAQARDDLRKKTLYKTAGGGRMSVVDEKIAVTAAQRRLEQAQAKLKAVERWKRQLEQEVLQYRGQVQAVKRMADTEMPRAAAMLDRVMDDLDRYVAVSAPRSHDDRTGEAAESMARPTGQAPPEEDGPDESDEGAADEEQTQP